MASDKIYTEEDVYEAIALVTRAFVEELADKVDPLTLVEVVINVVRNLEKQVDG